MNHGKLVTTNMVFSQFMIFLFDQPSHSKHLQLFSSLIVHQKLCEFIPIADTLKRQKQRIEMQYYVLLVNKISAE